MDYSLDEYMILDLMVGLVFYGLPLLFSSTPIPGNEKSVARVINELGMKGAKVIFQDTHVSGHACQEEIKLVYSLLKPKYASTR